MVYPWIYHARIYHVYPSSIYMVYPWIYMVYHWMYIHGIYVVYRGISMDIPRILKPDFAAGPCCWSHSMRTRVWVNQECLFHAPPWQLRQGTRRPTKGSTRLPPMFPACRWWRRWRRRRRRCRGRLSVFLVLAAVTAAAAAVSRVSFRFPCLVAGNDLNLGERWGRGCLQDRWPMCRTA